MDFFFVLDFRGKFRFFSSHPTEEIQVKFSRLKKIWEAAREKLMLLPPRILRQEQAFERALKIETAEVTIQHAQGTSEKKIRRRFFFFLQKQRSKHILLLILETLLLPISGLMALLPGPNVFFGILALLLLTHWQALRGINRLGKVRPHFIPSKLLGTWEGKLEAGDISEYPEVLSRIESEYRIADAAKILYK
jgi:hypothetical protein